MTKTEKEIFELLKKVALEDGVMRLDETNIISHAMRTAISFDWYLEEAMKDGVIDDEEKKELEFLRKKIYREAKEMAERDDKITTDEAKLLAKLAEKLEEYSKYEDL